MGVLSVNIKKMTRLRLNDIKSINNLMARTVNSLIAGNLSEDEARAIGYLANILYKGIEQEDKLEMDRKYQEAQIENLIARTKSLDILADDVEDLSEIYKIVYGEKKLEVLK